MLNFKRRDEDRPPMMPPAAESYPPQHRLRRDQFHEDALRFGQQVVDLEQENARLNSALAEESAAHLVARREIDMLTRHKRELEATLAQQQATLESERDYYKQRLNTVECKLQVSAKIILDCLNEQAPAVLPDMDKLADAIDEPMFFDKDGNFVPKVVADDAGEPR